MEHYRQATQRTPRISRAAMRPQLNGGDQRKADMHNVDSAVWLHFVHKTRRHEQKDKESAAGQLLVAAKDT